jgi:DNA-binding Lrp family transcriptional regulator
MTARFRPKEFHMSVEAYVFITTTNPGPRRACQTLRRLPGIVRADALFGTPDVVAIVTGDDLAGMDAVIDRIAELPEVVGTDSKVVRWIEAS